MRITEVDIDGFGPLHRIHLKLGPGVSVLYGPNEAGKSTLLRFIRSMLYGIPSRRDPVERAAPVHGGRHGGRMSVLLADGRQLAIERYGDGGGGARRPAEGWTVRDAEGAALRWSQAEWERRALGGVSERLFRQLFAVTLEDLHGLLALQGDEVGHFLYRAGMAGGASLAKVRRALAGEMDKLYRPKGTTPEINRLLAAIKETEAALRQGRGSVELFRETETQLAAVRERLAEMEGRLPSLAEEALRWQETVRLREPWLQRKILLAEEAEWLGALPAADTPLLPEEAAAAWSALMRMRLDAEERLRKAAAAVRDRQAEAEALAGRTDDRLLERADELERLEAMRKSAEARAEETEAVKAELRSAEEAAESLVARLSPGWDDGDLQAFADVLAEREPLTRMQQAWLDGEHKRGQLELDTGRLHRQRSALLGEAEAETADAADSRGVAAAASASGGGERAGGFAFRNLPREALQRVWNALEDELRALERAAAGLVSEALASEADRTAARSPRAGRKQGQSRAAAGRRYLPAGGMAAVAAALALVSLPMAGLPVAASSAAAAAAATLGLLALLAGWRTYAAGGYVEGPAAGGAESGAAAARSRARAEALLRELLERPEQTAAALFRDLAIDDGAWSRLRGAFQDRLAALESEDRRRAFTRERERRAAELDRERAALEAELQTAISRQEETARTWEAWLRSRRLPPSLTPAAVPELLALAEQAQAVQRRRQRARERLAALEVFRAAFREAAATLQADYPPPAALADEPALYASWLHRHAAEQQALREERRRAERSLREAREAEAEASADLGRIEAEVREALRTADAPDEAAYARRLRAEERLRVLRSQRRELELRLEAGKPPEAAAALYARLASLDEAALVAKQREAEETLRLAEAERAELLERRGRLAQELERLGREAETEERRQHLAALGSKLHALAERYAILAIGDRLLYETKAAFEEERQPEVLKLASGYFAAMTGGAYVRILLPVETETVWTETADRRVVDGAFLSRGTQEQLYLAMRFALAEAASRDAPLPLLLDDLFVHFDADRLRRTVPILERIAAQRQVVLFTCHRHVVEAIGQGISSARFIEWTGRAAEGGVISPAEQPHPG